MTDPEVARQLKYALDRQHFQDLAAGVDKQQPENNWLKGIKSIFGYANGGFVDRGQMFIAGEAGPEIVGTMGGKSAVANEDQIISGVAEGVRQGMSGSNQVIKLQIGQYEFEQLVVRTIQNYSRRTGGALV
jgi:hypothetical protein